MSDLSCNITVKFIYDARPGKWRELLKMLSDGASNYNSEFSSHSGDIYEDLSTCFGYDPATYEIYVSVVARDVDVLIRYLYLVSMEFETRGEIKWSIDHVQYDDVSPYTLHLAFGGEEEQYIAVWEELV